MAPETIPCAWCGAAVARGADVAAESHGICARCAAAWETAPAPERGSESGRANDVRVGHDG